MIEWMNKWNGHFRFFPHQFQTFFFSPFTFNKIITTYYKENKISNFQQNSSSKLNQLNWKDYTTPNSLFCFRWFHHIYIKQMEKKVCESFVKNGPLNIRCHSLHRQQWGNFDANLLLFPYIRLISFFFLFDGKKEKEEMSVWYWRSRPLKIRCHP